MRRSGSGSRRSCRGLRAAALAGFLAAAANLGGAAAAGDAPGPGFDGERAFSYLEAQCALGPRIPGSEGHAKALAYLETFFRDRGADVRRQLFTVETGESTVVCENLVATFFRGIGPKLLLCAHYDTRPWADAESDSARRVQPVPGANDGASGVAVLMEVANALASRTPLFCVEVALFDAEDMGGRRGLDYALGSSHYVTKAKDPPAAAILVDMVGDRDLTLKIERYSKDYAPSLSKAVWEAAGALGLEQFSGDLGDYIYDDHVPLLTAGIPAVDIIDLDYDFWHTTEDTPDKCSPESLKAVGTLILHLLYDPESPLLPLLR